MCFAAKFVSCHLFPSVTPQRCVGAVPIIIIASVVVGPNPPKSTVIPCARVGLPGAPCQPHVRYQGSMLVHAQQVVEVLFG